MVVKHLQTYAPGPEYKSQVVSTMADENQVKSFQEFNAKSIWTEELEKLLMEKKLDVIVHCLKGRSMLGSFNCEYRSFDFWFNRCTDNVT
jgi:porphobilinogen deaminase